MSCDNCKDLEIKDGEVPPCKKEVGCWIPPLNDDGQKAMEIRDKIIALQPLVDPGAILKIFGAKKKDLLLLAAIEEELKSAKETTKNA